MEDHEGEIRGKQVQWHREVKDQVFADEEHIPVKRISEKIGNMRKAWRDAKAMQERSEWGVKPINEILKRKCTFLGRLEEIWGSRQRRKEMHSLDIREYRLQGYQYHACQHWYHEIDIGVQQ